MTSNVNFDIINSNKILKIEFDNSNKNNALSLKMLSAITSKLSDKSYINKFSCLVFTGAKNGPYSSGADLGDLQNLIKKNKLYLYHNKITTIIEIINKLDIPVISLIRSYCFGAGLIIALASDILLASENTFFCIPASKLNIKLPEKQILFLNSKVNRNFLKDIILSSRKFTASEAYKNNLINDCIKDEIFNEYTRKYLVQIANKKKINTFYLKLLKTI